jgi:hypothetical protein
MESRIGQWLLCERLRKRLNAHLFHSSPSALSALMRVKDVETSDR